MMHTIAATGAGLSGASAVHMNIFGLHPVVVFGTAQQKQRWLPPLIAGQDKACFGVTEPNTGLNTLKLKTRAVRQGDYYVVTGQKVGFPPRRWPTRSCCWRAPPRSKRARAAKASACSIRTWSAPPSKCTKSRRWAASAWTRNQLFIDNLRIPVEDRIGRRARGSAISCMASIRSGILIAAEAVGLGRAALRKAAGYAREREVFDRPIGRTRASSIRWRVPGWNWRPRT